MAKMAIACTWRSCFTLWQSSASIVLSGTDGREGGPHCSLNSFPSNLPEFKLFHTHIFRKCHTTLLDIGKSNGMIFPSNSILMSSAYDSTVRKETSCAHQSRFGCSKWSQEIQSWRQWWGKLEFRITTVLTQCRKLYQPWNFDFRLNFFIKPDRIRVDATGIRHFKRCPNCCHEWNTSEVMSSISTHLCRTKYHFAIQRGLCLVKGEFHTLNYNTPTCTSSTCT